MFHYSGRKPLGALLPFGLSGASGSDQQCKHTVGKRGVFRNCDGAILRMGRSLIKPGTNALKWN
ncbi:hypothetical protein HY58_06480 [Flavihumibacter sp. ZG627]|nr:hypothetical protein HY58_06480 [Flavihumibacter sp. ZG627]